MSCFDHDERVIKYFAECDGRRYGQNCSKTCGFCFENEQCHFINGTCLNGCSNGYWGDGCEKSKYSSHIKIRFELLSIMFDITTIIANIFYIFNEHILYTKDML